MPRYHFNLLPNKSELDLDGTELSDIYVAQGQAIRMAGEIMRDLGAAFWEGNPWRLEVTDAIGRILFIVRFSAEEHS